MNFEMLKAWLLFFLHAWRSPNTYRKLFRDISSCYFTPQAPGKATIAGFVVDCITSSQRMIVTIDGAALFYINRDTLLVRTQQIEEDMPLYDRRIRPLKLVFDEMIRKGMPFKMSDINNRYTQSDVYGVKVEPDGKETQKSGA
jgi:hypothetical protein